VDAALALLLAVSLGCGGAISTVESATGSRDVTRNERRTATYEVDADVRPDSVEVSVTRAWTCESQVGRETTYETVRSEGPEPAAIVGGTILVLVGGVLLMTAVVRFGDPCKGELCGLSTLMTGLIGVLTGAPGVALLATSRRTELRQTVATRSETKDWRTVVRPCGVEAPSGVTVGLSFAGAIEVSGQTDAEGRARVRLDDAVWTAGPTARAALALDGKPIRLITLRRSTQALPAPPRAPPKVQP